MSKNISVDSILSKALDLCQPSPEETKKVARVAGKAKELISKYSDNFGNKVVGVEFGGSFAKGTWLKGDTDIDIFIKIDPSVTEQEFEKIGIQTGLQSLKKYKTCLRYSDHPYVEAFVDKIRVNVVPCYLVDQGKWKSAADRSPFHTEYIKNNFGQEKKDQVRLLKKFLKSNKVYGAEIAKGGFSGYVSEVLIQKYGTLEGVLQAISSIDKQQQVISVGIYDPDVVKGFQSPLVIIDPIDSRRNLGTAISAESVGRLVLAARAFLDKPSISYFKQNGTSGKKVAGKNLLPNMLVIEFTHRERSPDIIWGQLKRSLNAIAKQLELAEFNVIRNSCVTDEKSKAAFVFLLESMTIPLFKEKKGPEIFRKSDTASFVKGNLSKSLVMWIDRDMRTSVLVKRKETDARKFAKGMLLTNKIGNSGITKGIVEDIGRKKSVQIYSGSDRKLNGLVKEAVNGLVTTESRLFG